MSRQRSPLIAPFRIAWGYIRGIWRFSGRAWRTHQPDPDPLAWVFRVRDIAALVLVVCAALYWRWGHIDFHEQTLALTTEYILTAMFAVLVVVVTAVVFVLVAKRGFRRHTLANTSIPLVALATALTVFTVPYLLFFAPGAPATALVVELTGNIERWALVAHAAEFWPGLVLTVWRILVATAGVVLGAGAITAMVAAISMGVQSRFRVGDAHPFMAAVVSMILALWALGRGAAGAAAETASPYPWWALALLTYFGPLVVIALSVWQIVRLRRMGVRFREPFFAHTDDPVSRGVGSAVLRLRRTTVASDNRSGTLAKQMEGAAFAPPPMSAAIGPFRPVSPDFVPTALASDWSLLPEAEALFIRRSEHAPGSTQNCSPTGGAAPLV